MAHQHTHSPDNPHHPISSDNEKRMLFAMLLTASFMCAEVVGGVISGSLALLSDAGHMLTDTVALAMAWYAARVSKKPADNLRSYGYHRIQILAALINGIAFVAIVVWIVIEAIKRIQHPVEVMAPLMMWVAVLGLLVNIIVFAILHRGDSDNLNMRAALIHVVGDLLGSVAAICAAAVIIWTGWMPIDPILSVLVALLILRSAWFVIKRSIHILLEGAPEGVDVESIRRALREGIPGVNDIHHVHIWSLTPDKPLITLHVDIEKLENYTQLLGQVKSILSQQFGIHHSTIQIEHQGCADQHS